MPSPDFINSWFNLLTAGATKPLAINFPGSGSIGGFTYQPNTVWEAPSLYRGNPTLEQNIYSNVASPGKQLGKLMDAVLVIARLLEKDLQDEKAIGELQTIADMIERLKAPVLQNSEDIVRAELDKLLMTNKASLQSLLTEFGNKLDEQPG
jgi:hypothetical protein